MDILFIHAGFSEEERYGNKHFGKVGRLLSPLGLASLSAYLKKYGFRCGILDTVLTRMSLDEIVRYVLKVKPGALGFTALTPTFSRVKTIAEHLKRAKSIRGINDIKCNYKGLKMAIGFSFNNIISR